MLLYKKLLLMTFGTTLVRFFGLPLLGLAAIYVHIDVTVSLLHFLANKIKIYIMEGLRLD